MEKLIIDRTKWLRGEGSEPSKLRRAEDSKMCCLGFDALRRGFSEEEITNVGAPSGLNRPIDGLTEPLSNGSRTTALLSTDSCVMLMVVNDAIVGADDDDAAVESEADREVQLTELFAEIGIDVEFVN